MVTKSIANNAAELSFEELLSHYDYKFKKGDLIKGIIIGYDNSGVYVDIGAKASAFGPAREIETVSGQTIKEALKQGEEYEFLIIKEEDDEGQLTVSQKKVNLAYHWKELQKIFDQEENVEGEVKAAVKGGLLVEVMGVRGFVPTSHLRVRNIDDCIGEKLQLKILSMDHQTNNLILSHRKVVSDTQAEKRKDTFEKVEVGSVIEGEVVRLADFGAFIDIGGIDGLLPLSQMSWRWVDHPSDILKVGETIKIEVIGIDHDKQRVSLSLKNLQPDPWVEAKEKIKEGEKIKGKVTRVKSFGAFVEVYPGVEALLPQKELLEYQNKEKTTVNVDSEIETIVIRFNPEDRRISLSVTGEVPVEE
ncbi:MAG: S1 RNA-binding domain-containing protein [Candidatus Gastranaerophilaceae bacterium]|jgi:ribosomal protein S1